MPGRSAVIFRFSDLPAAAQQKGRGQGQENYGKTIRDLRRENLSPQQRAAANNADVAIIIDNDNKVILEPTGDFASAIQGMHTAIADAGIN